MSRMDIEILKENIKNMKLIDKKIKVAKKKFIDTTKQDKVGEAVKYLDRFFEELVEYSKLKRNIKSITVFESVSEISDKDLRGKIQTILSDNQLFEADKELKDIGKISNFSFNSLSDEEVDLLSLDQPLANALEITESLYKTKSLILGTNVPEDLKLFVDEARKSYAFWQYNSSYSMCRTMLETAIYDICIKMGKIDETEINDPAFFREYPPCRIIKMVSKGRLLRDIQNLYRNLSSLIHGKKTIKKNEAKEALEKTIGIIQTIYDNKQNSFI